MSSFYNLIKIHKRFIWITMNIKYLILSISALFMNGGAIILNAFEGNKKRHRNTCSRPKCAKEQTKAISSFNHYKLVSKKLWTKPHRFSDTFDVLNMKPTKVFKIDLVFFFFFHVFGFLGQLVGCIISTNLSIYFWTKWKWINHQILFKKSFSKSSHIYDIHYLFTKWTKYIYSRFKWLTNRRWKTSTYIFAFISHLNCIWIDWKAHEPKKTKHFFDEISYILIECSMIMS